MNRIIEALETNTAPKELVNIIGIANDGEFVYIKLLPEEYRLKVAKSIIDNYQEIKNKVLEDINKDSYKCNAISPKDLIFINGYYIRIYLADELKNRILYEINKQCCILLKPKQKELADKAAKILDSGNINLPELLCLINAILYTKQKYFINELSLISDMK